MAGVASFHLIRERPGRQPLVLLRLATDRRRLRHVEGLLFWRLLGTGRADDAGPGADLRRCALFAVWRDEASLERFLSDHPIALRWRRAEEAWHVRLRGVGGHGSWAGFAVADELAPGRADGTVAVITRARIRPAAWRSFAVAARALRTATVDVPGLIDVVGIGEAPIGRLGTFSLWESQRAAAAFAACDRRHAEAMAQARASGWFRDELFARFEPYGSAGSWSGRDPLAAAPPTVDQAR